MRTLDMTFCSKYQNCPQKDICFRSMKKDQEDFAEKNPCIPIAFCDFSQTNECPIKGTDNEK